MVMPPGFQMLVCVLDHDDRRVDHRADRDCDATERHDVRVDALRLHHDERREYAERQRDDRHQRRTQVKQERSAHERDDEELFEQLAAQVVDRAPDQLRTVIGLDDLDAGRQARLQRRKLGLYRINGGLRVLALAHHDHTAGDFTLAVEFGNAAAQFRAELHACDVAEQHRHAACADFQ